MMRIPLEQHCGVRCRATTPFRRTKGVLCRFRFAYLKGWLTIVGCQALRHRIARRRNLKWINVAFFLLNAVASAVFFVVVAAEVIFQGGFKLR